MNSTRIGLGIAAWFLGILVPVMHHILLHWPLAAQSTNNIISRSQYLFRFLPWIDWVYLAAMAVVGLILVVSGMKSSDVKG
jgi:hypothetical protein